MTRGVNLLVSQLTLGVPLRLSGGAELVGLFTGHRYSNISTPATPCWRPRDPASKVLALLLRRKTADEREGTSTRMATRPVPSAPGPGGTLQRTTVWDTISDFIHGSHGHVFVLLHEKGIGREAR